MDAIEVAENLAMVIKTFIDSGLTIEQTAMRMDEIDWVLTEGVN